jgi:hypothetical protein
MLNAEVGSVGGCFGLIYPVVLFIFMMLPKVAAAFRPPAPAHDLPRVL